MVEMAFILVELWHNATHVLDFLMHFTLIGKCTSEWFEKEGKWNWHFITTYKWYFLMGSLKRT
jgi:hypothetical protein